MTLRPAPPPALRPPRGRRAITAPRAARSSIRRPRAALALLAAAGAALLAAGCGGAERAAADVPAVAARLAPEVERAVGRPFRTPPRVATRSRGQVREVVTRLLAEPRAQREVAGLAAAYRLLGVVPDSVQLPALLRRLLEEQIVGYYDPRADTLYVVEGAKPDAVESTLRHELVHALQDQYVNIDSIQRVEGEGDRTAAAQAALEGQATHVQLQAGGLVSRTSGAWDRVRDQIRGSQNAMPVFAGAPLIVQESLLFPYLSGGEFVRRVVEAQRAESLWARLPVSSEQVLHPAAWLARGDSADRPTAVALPAPRAGTVAAANTLGEFETRIFLYQFLQDQATAVRAAQGWDGDRWQVVRTAGGDALVWLSVWDDGVEAADFYDALVQLAPRRHRGARPAATALPTARAWTVAAPGGARAVLVRATEVAGRAAVLYVDAPAAAGTDLTDLTAVGLRE